MGLKAKAAECTTPFPYVNSNETRGMVRSDQNGAGPLSVALTPEVAILVLNSRRSACHRR